jgi:hypothetical protein
MKCDRKAGHRRGYVLLSDNAIHSHPPAMQAASAERFSLSSNIRAGATLTLLLRGFVVRFFDNILSGKPGLERYPTGFLGVVE